MVETKICLSCGQEVKETGELKFTEYPEFGIEVSQIIDWDKPYNEIVVPEGCRLMDVWELWRLLESKYSDAFLGAYKGKYNYFWCEQTKYAKENNYSSGLSLYWYSYLLSYYEDLASSHSYGRVAFVRDLKVEK